MPKHPKHQTWQALGGATRSKEKNSNLIVTGVDGGMRACVARQHAWLKHVAMMFAASCAVGLASASPMRHERVVA